jgi:hypothetical protein
VGSNLKQAVWLSWRKKVKGVLIGLMGSADDFGGSKRRLTEANGWIGVSQLWNRSRVAGRSHDSPSSNNTGILVAGITYDEVP